MVCLQPNDQPVLSKSLRSLVVRDNLQFERDMKLAEKKKARGKACQASRSWYAYTEDDDDEQPPSNQSIDLSGSRFIY